MDDFIRARTPEQKAQRMAEIKAATAEQFATLPYHEVTLTTIAVALGWSRGNLYKYVATKEEIFLGLYEDAFAELVEALDVATSEVGPRDVRNFAQIVAHVSVDHTRFFHYQNLLLQVIETNVTLERLTEYKRTMEPRLQRLQAIFRRCLPDVSDEQVWSITQAYRHEASGLVNTVECSEVTVEAMRLAGIEHPQEDLEPAIADFLERLLGSYLS